MYTTSANTSRPSIRDAVANFLVRSLTPLYQTIRYKRKPWQTTKNDLKQCGPGTLGNAMYRFLDKHDLDLIPKAETHDVWHVLFGYTIEMKDEMSIQFVVLGNGRHSAPYLYSCLVAVLMYPEYWGSFYTAYQRGASAISFAHFNFEELLNEDLAALRKSIFGSGIQNEGLISQYSHQ